MQQGLYNYIIQTIFWNICFWTFQGVRKTSSCDSYLYCLGYWYCWFLQLFIAKIILTGLNKRTRLIWTQVCESFLTQSSGLGWCPYSILYYLLLVLVLLVLVLLGLWYHHHLHFLHCPLTVFLILTWCFSNRVCHNNLFIAGVFDIITIESCGSWFATAGQLSSVKLIGFCSERSFYRTITGLKIGNKHLFVVVEVSCRWNVPRRIPYSYFAR